MALVHVLDAYASGLFRCAVHVAAPVGTNAAGFPWRDVFLAAGRSGRTVMIEGLGPGNISTAERALIASGDVIEFVVEVDTERRGADLADVSAEVDAQSTRLRSLVELTVGRWKRELRFWGVTRA